MSPLSTERINARAPYEVSYVPGEGYTFLTSRDIHYLISFDNDQPLGGCDTCQFIIQKLDHQRSSHDSKVEQTILAILDVFFATRLDVLIYFCDTSDGREAKRNRLFLSWFEHHAEPGRFTIRTAHATVEGQGFYAAVIVENRNPKLADVVADFEETAAVLTAGKPQ